MTQADQLESALRLLLWASPQFWSLIPTEVGVWESNQMGR